MLSHTRNKKESEEDYESKQNKNSIVYESRKQKEHDKKESSKHNGARSR